MRRRRHNRARWRRRAVIALGALVVLLVVVRLVLDPIVAWRTRIVLNEMENYRGRFSDVHVSVHDLSYTIHELRIEKLSAAGAALPFFEAERVELGLYWKELVHGHVVAGIRLLAPKLNLLAAESKKERQLEDTGKVAFKIGDLAPFKLERVEVRDGEVLFVDATTEERPKLWLHDLEATLENFATREALSAGEPTVLAMRGILQKTGKLTIFATMDPMAKSLTFSGQARVEGMHFPELGELLVAKTGLSPKRGTLDISARFIAKDGLVRGSVRPVLKDPDVDQGKPGLGEKLKAGLVDLSLDLFSDDIPDRDGVATTIPIEGRVDAPQVEALPTILGIVRNAFITGLADSLTHLPPRGDSDPRAPLRQARRGEKK